MGTGYPSFCKHRTFRGRHFPASYSLHSSRVIATTKGEFCVHDFNPSLEKRAGEICRYCAISMQIPCCHIVSQVIRSSLPSPRVANQSSFPAEPFSPALPEETPAHPVLRKDPDRACSGKNRRSSDRSPAPLAGRLLCSGALPPRLPDGSYNSEFPPQTRLIPFAPFQNSLLHSYPHPPHQISHRECPGRSSRQGPRSSHWSSLCRHPSD